MNINYLASGCLNATYRVVPVAYYQSTGKTNVLGTVAPAYASPITLNANIQLVDKQKLQHKDYYNATTIYKAFWINLDTITGLNRNISSGGDYFLFNSLKYKVVGIENEFQTNWICVICAQGVAGNE